MPVELASADQEQISIGLDAGTLRGGPASTVVDLRSGIEVVREGPISSEQIQQAIDRQ